MTHKILFCVFKCEHAYENMKIQGMNTLWDLVSAHLRIFYGLFVL